MTYEGENKTVSALNFIMSHFIMKPVAKEFPSVRNQ